MDLTGIDKDRIPKHVAAVMDGNGRWATQRGLKRTEGHAAGEHALFDTLDGAIELGLEWFTVYAFSTENWKRPTDEVRFLMGFNKGILDRHAEDLHARNVRIQFIGRRDWRVPRGVAGRIDWATDLTKHNTGLTFTIAFNYGGRAEIIDAVKQLVADGVKPDKICLLYTSAPKTWALQHSERAALMSSRPVKLMVELWPLRMIARGLIGLTNVILPGKGLKQGPFVSEEELLAVAAEAAESNQIEHDERRLIESIIEFGDTVVREVMVPRPDMVCVQHDFRVADVMEVVLLNGYSRVPVLGEGIDDVIGLVFAKDLMRAERDGREDEAVTGLVRPARAVPETKPVSELLREMQADQFHMAIVIDEYGGTAGLVTLEDLIEELVGEIVDEFDTEDARIEPIPSGGVRVSGSLTIDDANDLLPVELPEGDYDTVSGLVLSGLGRLAATGDTVQVPGARLTVERVQGRRIMRVRIEELSDEDELHLDADQRLSDSPS